MQPSPAEVSRDRALTAAMCVACACSVASFGSYPALIPRLFAASLVTTREATFVNSSFFAGYMLVAPLATSLTDRVDARRLVLPALAAGALSSFLFALLQGHFWAAVLMRAASGACVAASFMPGLRALTDRLPTERSTRFVGFYMSSFALGTSLSYVVSDLVAERFGLTATLYAMALGPALARLVVAPFLKPVPVPERSHAPFYEKIGPVIREPAVVALVLAYGLHCAELFALRSWCVAFLSAVQDRGASAPPRWLAPAAIVALANVLTAPASVLGNELSLKLGARRYLAVTLTLSPLCFGALGLLHDVGPLACTCAVLGCALVLGSDSAAITSRLIQAVSPEQRGVSMALHTAVGFLGAFLGPTLLGLVLDAAGGPGSSRAWALAFAAVGALSLSASLGLLAHSRAGRFAR
jgi:MFS family permease